MASDHVNAAIDIAHYIESLEEQNIDLEAKLHKLKKSPKKEVVLDVLQSFYRSYCKLHKKENAQWHELLDMAAVEVGEEYGIHHCTVQDHIWKLEDKVSKK